MEDSEFDWKSFEKQAINQLMKGEPLEGKDGVLTPLIKRLLEAGINGEMNAHVEANRPNRRNGYTDKSLKTSHGTVELNIPRDREGSFDSLLIPKRRSTLGASLDNKILGLYGLGMSYADISGHLREIYGLELSEATLCSVTDKVYEQLSLWQTRQLEAVYPFVWLDALHYKVRHEGRVVTRAVYTILGLNLEGKKELLGLYLGESEGARFWLSVLSDLQSRGVEDILIASIDGLKGFPEAIETIYPHTKVQLCLVHQMRNSLRYIIDKDSKQVARQLKCIYNAPNQIGARQAFDQWSKQWGKKYPVVQRSWTNNWDRLMTMYEFPQDIRRIIYTTNMVEGLHRQLRKVTKTKGAFTHDMALMKLLFMTQQRISKKWNKRYKNWGLTIQQLHILYGDRLKLPGSFSDTG